jgi:hypothetical protein
MEHTHTHTQREREREREREDYRAQWLACLERSNGVPKSTRPAGSTAGTEEKRKEAAYEATKGREHEREWNVATSKTGTEKMRWREIASKVQWWWW